MCDVEIEMELVGDVPGNVGGFGANGIPAGGTAGQILYKKSDKDFDAEWRDLEIPSQYGLVTYDQDKNITVS